VLIGLLKSDGTSDLGVTTEDSNYNREANVNWMSAVQRVPNKAGIEHIKTVVGFKY